MPTLIKQNEEIVHRRVTSGELSIDEFGIVWRFLERTGGRGKLDKNSVPCDKRLAGTTCNGYRRIRIREKGKYITCYAHRLVWYHTNGHIPEGLEVNHINGNKSDNRLDNLELVTHRENSLHSREVLGNSLIFRGSKHGMSKLTDFDIKIIRERYNNGEKVTSISKDYDVNYSTISRACHNKTWVFPK